MQRKLLPGLGLILLVVILLVTSGMPVSALQSAPAWSDMARLQGMRIYFSESNGEASRFDRSENGLSRFAGLLQRYGATLNTLEWRNGIPADADLVIIAGPPNDLDAQQTARLWVYLQNGGKLLLLAEPSTNTNRVRAFRADDGLFSLTWPDMGIQARNDVVVTEGEMRTITPEDDEDPETPPEEPFDAPILITDLVTTDVNATHPITQNLDGELAFFMARSLDVDATSQISETVGLIYGPADYYGETNINEYDNTGAVTYVEGEDSARGGLPLAAAAVHPDTGARVVLIGDRDFATNGGGFQTSPPNSPSFLYTSNVDFMLNAVAWLLGTEPADMSFPTPGPTSTPVDTPTPAPEEDTTS